MKHATSAKTVRRALSNSHQDSATGPNAVALAPPNYGIDLVDYNVWEAGSLSADSSASKDGSMVVQPKLMIGPPGDQYEREAERIAARVVNGLNGQASTPTVQRGPDLDAGPIATPVVRRRSGEAGFIAAPPLEAAIHQARGSGQPLGDAIRAPMEQAFGADFSGVRIHTDAQADCLSSGIEARAFTTGQDIFFKRGEHNPASRAGQELIAHELTHVEQSKGSFEAPVRRSWRRKKKKEKVKQDPGLVSKFFYKGKKAGESVTEKADATEEVLGEKQETIEEAIGDAKGLKDDLESFAGTFQQYAADNNWQAGKDSVAKGKELIEWFNGAFALIKNALEEGKEQLLDFFKAAKKKISACIPEPLKQLVEEFGFARLRQQIEDFQERKAHRDALQKAAQGGDRLRAAAEYGFTKVSRSVIEKGFQLTCSIIQLIVRVVTILTGGIGAAVTGGIELAVNAFKTIAHVGRKGKGVYKFLKGTRGVKREASANVIVDEAHAGDENATKLIYALEPEGIATLLVPDLDKLDLKKLHENITRKDANLDDLKAGLAEKLKSS